MKTIKVFCDLDAFGYPKSYETDSQVINENMIVTISEIEVAESNVRFSWLSLLNGSCFCIDPATRRELISD